MKKGFNKKLPEIVINYSPKLDPIFLGHTRYESKHKELWQKWEPWSVEQAEKKVAEYKKEWKKYEKQILEEMCTVLGVSFYKNVIGVYIVVPSMRNFSDPIIIRGTDSPEEFVITLTHELIHELIPYTEDKSSPDFVYLEILKKMFPGEHRKTVIFHVILYAVMEYLFKDVLQKQQLWNIITKKAESHEDYEKAIKILKKQGYKQVIEDFKDKFKEYKKTTPKDN